MLTAVAEMERDLLIERTQAGLARARSQGKVLGRPSKTTPAQRTEILRGLRSGRDRERSGTGLQCLTSEHHRHTCDRCHADLNNGDTITETPDVKSTCPLGSAAIGESLVLFDH